MLSCSFADPTQARAPRPGWAPGEIRGRAPGPAARSRGGLMSRRRGRFGGPSFPDAGWGAAAIGIVWLVGAAVETVLSPVTGRISDRRGRMLPVRINGAMAYDLSGVVDTGRKIIGLEQIQNL